MSTDSCTKRPGRLKRKPGKLVRLLLGHAFADRQPPITQLIALGFIVLATSVLWIYSTHASMYVLQPTPGHHVVCYVESSSGCLLLLVLWDARGLGALPPGGNLHGPLTPSCRWAFFGHENSDKLHPFELFRSIRSSSSAFGYTVPYWLFIILAVGYGMLTVRRWLRLDQHNRESAPDS